LKIDIQIFGAKVFSKLTVVMRDSFNFVGNVYGMLKEMMKISGNILIEFVFFGKGQDKDSHAPDAKFNLQILISQNIVKIYQRNV
jgi:hypothetical protein